MNKSAKPEAGYGIVDGVIWQQILLFFFPILLGTFSSSFTTPPTP